MRAFLSSSTEEGSRFIHERTKLPEVETPTGPERRNTELIEAIQQRAAEMGHELAPGEAVMLSRNQGQLEDFFAEIPAAELELGQARVDSVRERFDELDTAASRLELTPTEVVAAKNRFLVEIGLQSPGQVFGEGVAAFNEEVQTLLTAAGGGRPNVVVSDPNLPAPGTRTPLAEVPVQRGGPPSDASGLEGLAQAIRAHPAADQELLGQVDTILALSDADATPQAKSEALEFLLGQLEGT